MPPAARKTDNLMHNGPHCHMLPGHPTPGGPVPMPVPTLPPGLPIVMSPAVTVKINGLEAATVTAQSQPCALPGCVPGGPGMIVKGSSSVIIMGLPAGCAGDDALFAACAVGCVPMPKAAVMPPCSPTVIIGG